MAATNEWTAYHLTRDGWVEGDKQRDFAPLLRRPAPPDRVLSIVYKETGSGYGSVRGSSRELWRGDDEAKITELLAQFGPAPQEL